MLKNFHFTNELIVAAAETILLLVLSVFLPSSLSFLIRAICGLYLAMTPAAIVVAVLYVRKHKNGKAIVGLCRETVKEGKDQAKLYLKEVSVPLWGIGILIAVGAFFPRLLRCMILSGIILVATTAPFVVVAIFRSSCEQKEDNHC